MTERDSLLAYGHFVGGREDPAEGESIPVVDPSTGDQLAEVPAGDASDLDVAIESAHRFTRDVEAGRRYINEWFAGVVETPFGGYGMSGFGRDKGLEAIENSTQVKNVCANIDRRP